MTDFYGNITWWGFSPALDLQETGFHEMCSKLSCAAPEELNILVVGAGDCRHILKTVARSYRHIKRKLNFYIIETALELYARDILMMMIALEQQQNMGLQDKVELFLELYGNSLVRQQSSQYVQRMVDELIRMVTDFDYMKKKLPFLDLTQLKYKERDFLESIFKLWRNKDKKAIFDISKCWDLRLRQLLGVRYDSRLNVFDWDYNMELIERGGSIVYVGQYKNWRNTGVAFQIREGTYDVPNITLASLMVFKMEGDRFPRRGYWGDMIVSPYITFGIETEEKSFYKKQNNQHTKTAEDITEFNILSLFYELANKKQYHLPEQTKSKVEVPKNSATLTEINEEEEELENQEMKAKSDTDRSVKDLSIEESKLAAADMKGKEELFILTDNNAKESEDQNFSHSKSASDDHEWLPLDEVKVIFLPLSSTTELVKKKKYSKLFNVVFFSNSTVHNLKPELNEIFADKCSLILESALFMLDIKKDNVKEFVKKVSGFATAAGCKPLETCDDLQDSYLKFYFER
ncbi:dynein axonemal assembly factor 3-like [Biomphalaria glabrata]|uniref:Dynein axonemal assembly factor 3-like n=1 Tax=Biomphalaria glabrata TaxID=6526 RepID=A0A9W3BKE9_BIOGL|nr:dynein axonemal assembly factor 3-like [Biomphalaria glabrata]